MKKLFAFICSVLMCTMLYAQQNPVKWTYSVNQISATEAELVFKAQVSGAYHLYSQFLEPGGPMPTIFHYPKSKDFKLVGKASESPKPVESVDDVFGTKVAYFKKDGEFRQKIQILSTSDFEIKGTIDYQVCDEETCIPFSDIDFNFKVKGAPVAATTANVPEENTDTSQQDAVVQTMEKEAEAVITQEDAPEEDESLMGFFILAILAGIAAVFTPCVFPMIPMTVSFFMSGDSKRSSGIVKGLIFTGSITLIYTAIGAIVALTKSADFANVLSTHWIPNSIFFALFIVFAFSFFGLFEITLPTGLSNKLDAKADKGGYISAFFMAAVLTIVSFSCTGPFVATLLVEAAMGASVAKPLLGMFLFGLAMGSPFFILSLSPSLMSKMPKSGGWLNSVKVVFAFVLLAFSMKFLLSIDQVYSLNIITREVYLAIWIVIFSLMGMYLMGKIKFSHDSDLPYIGVGRLMIVVVTFSFVIYLIPGLFGAPLKMVSALIPAQTTQQFDLSKAGAPSGASADAGSDQVLCGTPRYADKLHLPFGLKGYFDYQEALACAKEQNKPVFVDFKGHACANCKKMESEVWSDPRVQKLLKEYVIVALYGDDQSELPENEWVTSSVDGKVKKTMGKRNADFQISRFKTNTLPFYVMVDAQGNNLVKEGYGYDSDIDKFIRYLEEGLTKHKAKN